MLRVEKQITDSGLVQGQKKAQGQGLATQADQSQLFQSELFSILGNQDQANSELQGMSPEALLEAVEAKKQEATLAQAMPQSDALALAMKSETKPQEVNQDLMSLLQTSGEEGLTQEEVVAQNTELTKNIKSEIKVLEGLLAQNKDKVNVQVVEAETTPQMLSKNQAAKMSSPWSMKNILGEHDIPTKEQIIMSDVEGKEEAKKGNLRTKNESHQLGDKLVTELDHSNVKLKQAKSMQKFNSFKQDNPFKSVLENQTVDLKRSGPQVFEGDQKFESSQDINRNNILNLGQHGVAMGATHKLATNMTFKSAPEVELNQVNEVSQKIIDYIRQNSRVNNGNVEVQFNHDTLGDIVLKVNEAERGVVNINLQSLQKQGAEFFKANQAEIMDALSRSGIKVADFNVTQSSSSDNSSSWNFEGNSQGHQHQNKQNQQQHDSERRKQLWQQYQNQEAA